MRRPRKLSVNNNRHNYTPVATKQWNGSNWAGGNLVENGFFVLIIHIVLLIADILPNSIKQVTAEVKSVSSTTMAQVSRGSG